MSTASLTVPLSRLTLPMFGMLLLGSAAMFAAAPKLQTVAADVVAAPVTAASHTDAPMPVAALRHAEDRLDTALVVDAQGADIGFVQGIASDAKGRPATVRIGFGGLDGMGAHMVTLDARSLRYDPAHNRVLTRQSARDLAAMAARQRTKS